MDAENWGDEFWLSSGTIDGPPGGFSSAPLDWEQRRAFVKPRLNDYIEEWKALVNVEPCRVEIGTNRKLSDTQHSRESWLAQNHVKNATFEYSISNSSGDKCKRGDHPHACSTLKGEIALKSWIPTDISGIPPDEWWANHLKEPSFKPDILPFWNRSASLQSLQPLVVPAPKVDPSENYMPKVHQQTAKQAMLTFDGKRPNPGSSNKNRRDNNHTRALEVSYFHLNNPNAPRVNIYLRPAQRRDMPQITTIYNHLIENTVFVSDPYALSERQMTSRFNDIVEARLPFLVAVDRSSKGTRRNGARTGYAEHILGFAYADDYNDRAGLYRYTVEIEVYVDQAYLRKGIGRCLFDKTLIALDTHCTGRGGYDFVGDSLAYGPGGRRVVGTMIINFSYDCKDRDRYDWLQRWLSDFGFTKVGELEQIGHKLNTIVNQATFMKKTGTTIEAWAL